MKKDVNRVNIIYIIGIFLIFLFITLIIKSMSIVTITIIFKVISYLIMGYGAYISWAAFKASKKKAWILICIFCLSIFFVLVVRVGIKAIFHERYEKSTNTYILNPNGSKIKKQELTINFPIFQILLIIGLYYLAKDEIEKKKIQIKHSD